MVRVEDVARVLEAWAPPAIARDRDNVGLHAGDPDDPVRGILVALDPAEEIVAEARRRKANLIVTHHPLFFREVRSATAATRVGRILRALLRNDIALYVAHTNLDAAPGGTSDVLAALLGLQGTRVLEPVPGVMRKIVTFVPHDRADAVAQAMADAGAGKIGNYAECSFRSAGTGTFKGNASASPAIGRRGRREQVPEIRIEVVAPSWKVTGVLSALRRVHPYEEPAFDIYPLENRTGEGGFGAIGDLARPTPLPRFLREVKRRLGAGALRWTEGRTRTIRRVAVCGGSGSELLESAIRAGADCYVTADVKYHPFQEAASRIVLVDAGHFETERPVVGAIAGVLRKELRREGSGIPVHTAARMVNPVHVL